MFLGKDGDNVIHAAWEWQTVLALTQPDRAQVKKINKFYTHTYTYIYPHSPKFRMNFSLSLISIFCRSRLPWNTPQQQERTFVSNRVNKVWSNSWRILTAHNSKSRTPRDQTSVLGPEGRGASSWEESLGWKQPWAITSGARYAGYLGDDCSADKHII